MPSRLSWKQALAMYSFTIPSKPYRIGYFIIFVQWCVIKPDYFLCQVWYTSKVDHGIIHSGNTWMPEFLHVHIFNSSISNCQNEVSVIVYIGNYTNILHFRFTSLDLHVIVERKYIFFLSFTCSIVLVNWTYMHQPVLFYQAVLHWSLKVKWNYVLKKFFAICFGKLVTY